MTSTNDNKDSKKNAAKEWYAMSRSQKFMTTLFLWLGCAGAWKTLDLIRDLYHILSSHVTIIVG